ncbi:MAG: ribosome recycling factor [Bacteroidota bacterium]
MTDMTEEDIRDEIEMAKMEMDGTLDHLKNQLLKIRTGKASPAMLGGVVVPYYGSPTPLNQVANVAIADARTITIQPWEKNMIGPIEKAIFEANLGVTPQNDGELIRINVPPLTEDRRKQLVKQAKQEGEDAKVSLRNARRKIMEILKKAVKGGYPEDAGKRKEGEVDSLTKDFTNKIDAFIGAKEKDIMTV